MAWTAKWTIKRGKPRVEEVALAAGSSEAQSDTLSINLDITNMTKGEALLLIDSARQKIFASPWPPA
jgi:hypothetical protein